MALSILRLICCGFILAAGLLIGQTGVRHRARELGIIIGKYPTGRYNAITDVQEFSSGRPPSFADRQFEPASQPCLRVRTSG